jgi:hypothetical protein
MLATVAVTGLMVGSTARVMAATSGVTPTTGTAAGQVADDSSGQHSCAGKNACKGQGGCKTSDQGCKGKNTCKGKGGCKTGGAV